MFAALGRWTARRRWWVVIAALALVALGGGWGTKVFGTLTGGAGFDPPGAESTHADELLSGPLGRNVNDVVVLYTSPDRTVDDQTFAGPLQQTLAAVPRGGVTRLESYWTTGDEAFVSADRHATLVTVQLEADDEQARVAVFRTLRPSFEVAGLTTRFGGITAMTEQVNTYTAQDLVRAEVLSVPVLLILLLLIFRTPVAAALPLAIGVVATMGSFAVLRALSFVLQLSTFSINVITLLGLGLAIDYALFMVNRFREELARGRPVESAVERTTATAGRTVAFSALVLAISFTGLALFPSRFLRSMGYAGMSVVLFAALSALFLLPALLRFTGPAVNAWQIPLPRFGRPRPAAVAETDGRWYRVAHSVMRRPVRSTVGIVVVLVTLGLPFLAVNWARPAEWVLPTDAGARAVSQAADSRFPANPVKLMTVVVALPDSASTLTSQTALQDYAQRLDSVPGVTSSRVTGSYANLGRVTVGYAMDPMSREAVHLVSDVRALPAPPGSTALLTGMPASRVDIVDMVISRMPWMGLFVAVVSFVVLFLAFGSVTLPLKSVVMNLLSLSASFGAITLVFQQGYLSGLLDFVPVGAVDINFPVLIVAMAFGLAMDYEVFLMSRVREEWVRSGDPVESVALGVQRTAKIITASALLLSVVVGGFITSNITFLKMLGVGLVIAVVVDATIVRGLLVPATMRLLGAWAWWSPAPMARWWQRHGIREGDDDPPTESTRAEQVEVGSR